MDPTSVLSQSLQLVESLPSNLRRLLQLLHDNDRTLKQRKDNLMKYSQLHVKAIQNKSKDKNQDNHDKQQQQSSNINNNNIHTQSTLINNNNKTESQAEQQQSLSQPNTKIGNNVDDLNNNTNNSAQQHNNNKTDNSNQHNTTNNNNTNKNITAATTEINSTDTTSNNDFHINIPLVYNHWTEIDANEAILNSEMNEIKKLSQRNIQLSNDAYTCVEEYIKKLDDNIIKKYAQKIKKTGTVYDITSHPIDRRKLGNSILLSNILQQDESYREMIYVLQNMYKNELERAVQYSNSSSAQNNNNTNEPLYCICKRVSFGQMVACDNIDCKIVWYHFSCVGLDTKPRGKWYCPQCRKDLKEKQAQAVDKSMSNNNNLQSTSNILNSSQQHIQQQQVSNNNKLTINTKSQSTHSSDTPKSTKKKQKVG